MSARRETLASLQARIAADPGLAPLLEALEESSRRDSHYEVEHVLRIALWTLRFLPPEGDERAAIAAALLHDAATVAQEVTERTRAGERSAARAARLLTHAGFAPDAVRDICIAIRDHSYRAVNTPTSAIARALQDADRLEALGTLSILRTIATGARVVARANEGTQRWAGHRTLDDRALNVAHFFVKLLRLPAIMLTPGGKAEAERRAGAVRRFLSTLADDLDEPSESTTPEPPRE